MSEQPDEQAPAVEHKYQVTHYMRQAGQTWAWEAVTSAELAAVDAIRWVEQHAAGDHRADLQAAVSGQETQAVAVDDSGQAEPIPADTDAPDAVQAAPEMPL